jgi:hypothetical protein
MTRKGNGDPVPGPKPSKLGKLHEKIHKGNKTLRGIADTAKGRRIKRDQEKKEGQ